MGRGGRATLGEGELACGWAGEHFKLAGRADAPGSRRKSRHVTDLPAPPLRSHYSPSPQDPAFSLKLLIRPPCSIPNGRGILMQD